MQIKLNNKTLNISVEQATPDGMEKFSTIVIFKGDFKRADTLMGVYVKNYPDDAEAQREYEFLKTR